MGNSRVTLLSTEKGSEGCRENKASRHRHPQLCLLWAPWSLRTSENHQAQ